MIPPISRRKKVFGLLLLSMSLLSVYIYFRVNPNDSSFFPKCPLLTLTGIKCPGCGSQRAIHALLHADIRTAFSYNALFIISIPYILFLFGIRIYQLFRPSPPILLRGQQNHYIWIYFAATIFFGIVRNIFDF